MGLDGVQVREDRAADEPMNAARELRCDGCKHCAWIAPGGQRNDAEPHMRCRVLGRLPAAANRHGDYLHTLVPNGCPTYAQPSLC